MIALWTVWVCGSVAVFLYAYGLGFRIAVFDKAASRVPSAGLMLLGVGYTAIVVIAFAQHGVWKGVALLAVTALVFGGIGFDGGYRSGRRRLAQAARALADVIRRDRGGN